MKLLLASNSGKPLYYWFKKDLAEFINGVPVTFISAATVYDPKDYYLEAKKSLTEIGVVLIHLDLNNNPEKLIEESQAFLVGGGNTYQLLHQLTKNKLIEKLRQKVISGAKYVGVSAGANIAGPTILTANDWNVVGTKKFEGLNLVPFNINPHYTEPHDKLVFTAESRDDRILEHFVFFKHPIVALKEKSFLIVEDSFIRVGGENHVKVFTRDKKPKKYHTGAKIPETYWRRG